MGEQKKQSGSPRQSPLRPRRARISRATRSSYAIVAGRDDDGVQVIDVSYPFDLLAMGSATEGVDGFELDGAWDVATFVIGSFTYAIVITLIGGVQVEKRQ